MLICQLLCRGCNLFMCTLAWSQLKSAFEWYICNGGAAERDDRRLVINIPKSLLFHSEPPFNSHENIGGNHFSEREIDRLLFISAAVMCFPPTGFACSSCSHEEDGEETPPPPTRFSHQRLSCQSSAPEEESMSDGRGCRIPSAGCRIPDSSLRLN